MATFVRVKKNAKIVWKSQIIKGGQVMDAEAEEVSEEGSEA